MRVVVIIMELSPDSHRAYCPALPGCAVLGRSRQEAAERISRAVTGYLASFDTVVPEKLEFEIREHGLIVGGLRFVHWEDVSRFSWGATPHLLCLYFKARNVMNIWMDPPTVPEVDRLLREHLSTADE